MLDMFNYGVTEEHSEQATEAGLRNMGRTRAIRGGVAIREFLHKQGLAFVLATAVCGVATWNDALGWAAGVLFLAGWLLNVFVTKKLHDWGLRQIAVRVQFLCAVPEDEE